MPVVCWGPIRRLNREAAIASSVNQTAVPNATGKARTKTSEGDSARRAGAEDRPIQIAAVAGLNAAIPAAAVGDVRRGDQISTAVQTMAQGPRYAKSAEFAWLAKRTPEAASKEYPASVSAALVMRGTARRTPPQARFMQSTELGPGGMETASPRTTPVKAKFIRSTYSKALCAA